MRTLETIPSTTFSGRRFTRKQLSEVQETVETFKNLSRKELAQTLCEHLNWKTPNGGNKVNSCLTMLEELEGYGIVKLPEKRESRNPVRRIPSFEIKPETTPISDTLALISPIRLEQVISKEDREEWQAYLQTYHYLGYKHPVGSSIGYFVVSEARQQKLGCFLFSASAAWALAPRDQLIGWEEKHRRKLLHLILSNNRFLIFPWVDVPNLASHALSLATKQIADDWLACYGYRPALIETFVDTTKYSGTCYVAANWQYIGKTKGRGHFDPKHQCNETIKDIYVYPLEKDWKHTLTNYHRASSLKKKYRNDLQSSHSPSVDNEFITLWEKVAKIISDIALEYDTQWQIRQRVINSMLIILLIYRLVCSKNSQSYGTTIDELWNNCHRLDLSLPQKGSVAPSSFCVARMKLDEAVFKSINQRIIATYAREEQDESYRWLGHRIFAVDGSKVNLPRNLLACGYSLPCDNANYPQGMLSCLYQLKSQMPFDFELVAHANERTCALDHLLMLKKNDVVVYDRGYFSYYMLYRHLALGIHAVFRLQENSYTVISDFFVGSQTDVIATISPSSKKQLELKIAHPELDIVPIQMRLIKYHIGDQKFCLGTTLLDQAQFGNIEDFKDVYHSRWGVEELYKVTKRIFIIEDFHAKTERGVKQEIFAHFTLITMNRIFANQADLGLNQPDNSFNPLFDQINSTAISSNIQSNKIKINFKNCIHAFSRSIEELLLLRSKMKDTIHHAFLSIMGHYQKVRPGRSYTRKSMRPTTKWTPKKKTISKNPVLITPNATFAA